MPRIRKTHCIRGHLRTPEHISRGGACKHCKRENEREFKKTPKEKARLKIYRAKVYVKNKDKFKDDQRRRRYGITREQFDKMLKNQEGQCDICYAPFDCSSKNSSPHIDHDHETGAIRGLLCHKCNMCIGQMGDDTTVLGNAVGYLINHHRRFTQFGGPVIRRRIAERRMA